MLGQYRAKIEGFKCAERLDQNDSRSLRPAWEYNSESVVGLPSPSDAIIDINCFGELLSGFPGGWILAGCVALLSKNVLNDNINFKTVGNFK